MGAGESVIVLSACPEMNWTSDVGELLADETDDGVTGLVEYGVLGGYARG